MKPVIIPLLLILTNWGFSQDYYEGFVDAIRARDSLKQDSILKIWTKERPNDPDLLTSYFNHYIVQSKQSVLMIGETPPLNKEVLSVQDSNKTISYLYDASIFEPESYQKALLYIDSGLHQFPKRLDMHFGKIHVLGEANDWNNFTKSILSVLTLSEQNNHSWIWTKNTPLPDHDSIGFFLGAIQDYQLMLYNTGNDSLLKYMREIGLETIEIFPNYVESYSNVGVTYMILGDNDIALNYFLKGESLRPKDEIIVSNIAQCYYRLNNKEKAIEYYQKAFNIGDHYTKEIATQMLTELNGDK